MFKAKPVFTLMAVSMLFSGAAMSQPQHAHHQQAHGNPAQRVEIKFVHAEVIEVDLEYNEVVLRHEAIGHLNMAAMTMAFTVADDVDISHLSEGDEIMVKVERQDQDFVIIELETEIDHHDH